MRLAERLLTLGDGRKEIRTTHLALASELGTAREVVSRVLNDFHKRDLISQSRGIITFTDKPGLAALALTPLFYYLPKATLAATIIVAVLSLVDFSILKKTWGFARADFTAVAATIFLTLVMGVEVGVASGVAISVLLHLYKTSRPHVAEVGLVPGTQHFRNVKRHAVETSPEVLTLRVDESFYFVNARFLEDLVQTRVATGCEIKDVISMFSAVNEVDFSALESLEALNLRLTDMGVGLHLSQVKGPVMDRLKKSHLIDALNGDVFLSQFDAWAALTRGKTVSPP